MLPILGQIPLGLGVEEEFLLQFRRFVGQVGETFAKGILEK